MTAPLAPGAITAVVGCLLGIGVYLAVPTFAQPADPTAPVRTRHVLVLNSYQPGYHWSDDEVAGVRTVMERQPYPVELWLEHMDSRRFSGPIHDDRFERYLHDKYREHRFDLIISSDDAALTFLIDRRDRLFPATPVVFMGLNNWEIAARLDRRGYTGLLEIFHTNELIDVALALRPGTTRFVVIGDAAPTATAQLNVIRAVAARRPDLRFVIHDGTQVTLEEILAALGKTTPQDAIITTSFTRDHTGRYFPSHEAILRIIASARGPVFSESTCHVRQGMLACSENVGLHHGTRAAEMAAAVLAGTPPAAIPVESANGARLIVDYREVQRWGIDRRRLPADALLIHAPSSFYQANKYLIWSGVSFILLQAFVIGALVVNISRRRQVEGELASKARQLAVSNTDLQHLNESLRKEMSERQHAEEQLRQAQKMEAIGRLAGGVAHDFNNLLTVIGGCAYCLVEAIDAAHPARRLAEEVQRAGERAAALTKQLLAFGRKQVLLPVTVSLNDVVRGIEPMLRRLLGEDLTLDLSLTSESTAMVIDAGQIEQVIMNLAINARDAMPHGGRLLIETRVEPWEVLADDERPQPSALKACPDGQIVQLSVSDTGHGMDAATRSHIFEPFFSTKGGKGTGLGLATVYGIVTQSGGAIAVRSEPGRGTTFIISLPRTRPDLDGDDDEALTAVAVPIARRSARPDKTTVLLVEDEAGVRALAARMLRSQGYTVLEASCGEHAIAQVASHGEPIDLLLTDVVMPGMSGRQLAARLGELRPGLKVLFMSGYTDNVMAQHGVLEPGTELIEKPFTLDSLGDKVRAVLDA